MPTPVGSAGAVIEEVPSHRAKPTNRDAEVRQQEALAKEFAIQNGLVDDLAKYKTPTMKIARKKKIRRTHRDKPRQKLNAGETVTSDSFTWKVTKLLGSGGFGDVYKVVKENSDDKKEYAMKTEMVEGDKLKLRLKIEVLVLTLCHEITNPEKKKHFVAFIDRGKTDKFKFLIMGLVGKSLEDIRRTILLRNFSKATAMNASLQTLQSIWDLHDIGYLHRDIKPQNFAVGLGELENTIYMLDFGIARKYRVKDTKEVKVARISVKFLGTLRFASRACHLGVEQGRKDDLETWLYMLFDLFDNDSLPWKRAAHKNQVVMMKEKFIKLQFPKSFKIVPNEIRRIIEYIDGMAYADEPDYLFIQNSLNAIAKEKKIDVDKQLDWIGKCAKPTKQRKTESSSTSSDNRNTGSDDSDEEDKGKSRKNEDMGGKISSDTVIADNESLKKFSSPHSITDNDPFWNKLLSFNLMIDDHDTAQSHAFEDSLNDFLQSLMYNTQTSGNFAAFIRVFLRLSRELKASERFENIIFLWQASNALIILRHICKFLTQRMTEGEFVKTFTNSMLAASSVDSSRDESESENDSDSECHYNSTAERLLDTLIDILSELPVNSRRAAVLTRTLLRNYLVHNSEYHPLKKGGGSIVLQIASSFWSFVQAVTSEEEVSSSIEDYPLTLGSLSILLLLNLACHHPAKGCNPFKETLALFQNSQEVSSLVMEKATFKLDYNSLYERLCATACQEPPMLLLYLLLHRNSGFKNFVLSRINLENLVLPVLKILYDGVASLSSNSHHMYLALIVMLILSEDDFFCKIIHETIIHEVHWLESDHPLREISIGGLCVLVFVRTVHKNAIRLRDRYLHTNCLAALANMSSSFKKLSPIVCQKLVSLLELLTKRHMKMVEQMRVGAGEEQTDGKSLCYHDDVTALEEGIRTLLEIINSALCGNLRNNPHLIYTLLYHRNLFDSFQHHPMFQDLLKNIALVISHFSSKVVHVKAGDGAAMMEIIEKEAVVLPSDRLAKFPELRFRYVEDDNTVDFFVPYVWRLTIQHSSILFDSTRVKLFNARILNTSI